MAATAESTRSPTSRLEEILSSADRIEELSDTDTDNEYEDIGVVTGQHEMAHIEYINNVMQPMRDAFSTETSAIQDQTLEELLPFLEGNPDDFPLNSYGLPHLQRQKHIQYLKKSLGNFPAQYVALDAARPWLVYWSLQGLTALGYDISEYQQRVIDTFTPAQHSEGGFGGGFGQLPHLASSYAAILSLVIVGGSTAYEFINRKTMWHYLGRMKQANGGFTMAAGGEQDTRGAFCALVILSLLNIPLELPPDAPARTHGMTSFLDKLGEWISSCQTYEGGFGGSPGNEAHGAYTFCGLGCLSILGPPKETFHKYLDVPLLIHWLSHRQCAPEGGFSGRPNKLVDGCYSHWIGGCWPLVEAAVGKGIWNRSALVRYILSAAQGPKGGLRDKPSKNADAYHTCYNLAGLSAAQHNHVFDDTMERDIGKGELGVPYYWKTDGTIEEDLVWDQEDIVREVHPVFVVPHRAAAECREYFQAKEGF